MNVKKMMYAIIGLSGTIAMNVSYGAAQRQVVGIEPQPTIHDLVQFCWQLGGMVRAAEVRILSQWRAEEDEKTTCGWIRDIMNVVLERSGLENNAPGYQVLILGRLIQRFQDRMLSSGRNGEPRETDDRLINERLIAVQGILQEEAVHTDVLNDGILDRFARPMARCAGWMLDGDELLYELVNAVAAGQKVDAEKGCGVDHTVGAIHRHAEGLPGGATTINKIAVVKCIRELCGIERIMPTIDREHLGRVEEFLIQQLELEAE
ncbi:MAG: hypothetical protein LBT03_01075 [Holosporales bacterium]|jgi:hypothetical protein|nr:hypothetical protein [Holosporales bacterium]